MAYAQLSEKSFTMLRSMQAATAQRRIPQSTAILLRVSAVVLLAANETTCTTSDPSSAMAVLVLGGMLHYMKNQVQARSAKQSHPVHAVSTLRPLRGTLWVDRNVRFFCCFLYILTLTKTTHTPFLWPRKIAINTLLAYTLWLSECCPRSPFVKEQCSLLLAPLLTPTNPFTQDYLYVVQLPWPQLVISIIF